MNTQKKYNGEQERIQRALQRGRFFVPEEASFDYFYTNRKSTDIGSKINIALKAIENANGGKLRNIFGKNTCGIVMFLKIHVLPVYNLNKLSKA